MSFKYECEHPDFPKWKNEKQRKWWQMKVDDETAILILITWTIFCVVGIGVNIIPIFLMFKYSSLFLLLYTVFIPIELILVLCLKDLWKERIHKNERILFR